MLSHLQGSRQIISYKKKHKTFKNLDSKLINFLQKRFEINRKIDEVYAREIKRKIADVKCNNINTLSLLSYILLLKFDFEKNFSYLSTSLKISDFIVDNFSDAKDFSNDIVPFIKDYIYVYKTEKIFQDIGTIENLNQINNF